MATSTAASVREYLDSLDGERKSALTALRNVVLKAIAKVTESMAYGMPCYAVDGQPVCAFASQKHYMAFYVCNPPVMSAHADALAHVNCGKGCIRFKKLEQLPLKTVTAMLKELARKRRS